MNEHPDAIELDFAISKVPGTDPGTDPPRYRFEPVSDRAQAWLRRTFPWKLHEPDPAITVSEDAADAAAACLLAQGFTL